MSQRSRWVLFALLSIAILGIDQAVKAWARTALSTAWSVDVIPGIIGFRLVRNGGAAFGMLGGHGILFVVCAALVCIACAVLLVLLTPMSRPLACSLSMIFSGGIGNAIDRIAFGYVTDMIQIQFFDFPVFNVADIAITCGFVLFLICMIAQPRQMGSIANHDDV